MKAKTRKTRVAVIGCGVIGPLHLKCYAALPNVEVAAVCDLREERARSAAEQFAAGRWTVNPAEVFADPGIDAVSICTDHASHASLACAALAAGKHVLCEKSLARVPADLRRMLAAAAARPELVAAGVFQHRFEPVPNVVRDIIAAGGLGRLLLACGTLLCHRSNEYYEGDAWRGTIRGEGGSALINQAIHYFDLLLWMSGGATAVSAFQANLGHEGVIETEDTISVAVRFANGATGAFSTSNAAAQNWSSSLRFVGTKGSVELRDDRLFAVDFPGDPKAAASVEARVGRAVAAAEKTVSHKGKEYYGVGHMAQIEDFVRAIRTGTRPKVTFADAAETDALVFEAYRSAARAASRRRD